MLSKSDIYRTVQEITRHTSKSNFRGVDSLYNTYRSRFLPEEVSDKEILRKISQDLGAFDRMVKSQLKPTKNILKNILKKGEIKKMVDESFWDELDIGEDEFTPFLSIENGILYTFEFTDKKPKPRPHKDQQYNRKQWLWNVALVDAKPTPEKSEIGENYTLALAKRAMKGLRDMWFSADFDKDAHQEFTMKRSGTGFQTKYKFKVIK